MIRALVSWGPAVFWAAALFVLSSRPDVPGPSFPFADKVGHLGLYGILGTALAWGAVRSGSAGRWRWVGVGTLYGVSDEWHQSFIPGRSAEFADVGADAVGVALGFWITTWMLEWLRGRLHTQEA